MLSDRSRSLGLFKKDKTCIIAKVHRADLVICSHSRDGKTLSYSQINMVQWNAVSAGSELSQNTAKQKTLHKFHAADARKVTPNVLLLSNKTCISGLQIRVDIEDNSKMIFLISQQNIFCDPSLEPSPQEGSNDGS